jgi:hypothetical protein
VNRLLRGAVGVLVAAATLAGVRLGSLSTYTAETDAHALVRLAWRARGERVRNCRHRTPEELEKLPPHMRQEEVCEGRILPYRLVVELDGVAAVEEVIHGAGAREDRPLYVSRDLPVQPGSHRLAVTFARESRAVGDSAIAMGGLSTPAHLTLDTTVVVASRRVVLVTYDEEREQLVVRSGSVR